MNQEPCDGWVKMNFGAAGGPALRKECAHEDGKCYPTATIGGVHGSYDGVPPYATKIEAAMQVVEKMREQGWSFACTLYEGKLPYASFCKGTAKSSRNAEADALAEAICRAALAAIESTHTAPAAA